MSKKVQITEQQLRERRTMTIIDLGLATKQMPHYGMSAEEAWKSAISLFVGCLSKEMFLIGDLTKQQGAAILKAFGLDPDDALGGDGKKGWQEDHPVRRRA